METISRCESKCADAPTSETCERLESNTKPLNNRDTKRDMSEKTARQINDPQCGALELANREAMPQTPAIQPISILEKAIQGGVTRENVEVVKELVQMVREQRAEEAKAAFAASFFLLRKNMPEIYADREAKIDGKPVYSYCSEEEISKKLEPHLMSHGFAMLFGQTANDSRITVSITLIHEKGHQETREYSVHPGTQNKMKDATACDTGAATSAWRHLVIKMFGLKSRIRETDDARNLGENITADQSHDLQRRLMETGADVLAFLTFAGIKLPPDSTAEVIAKAFERIPSNKLGSLDAALRRKEKTA